MAIPAKTVQPQTSKKDEIHTPQVDGFKLKGELKGSIKDIANTLRAITFLEIAPEKDLVNVVYVESRDISRNPHLFSITKIKGNEIEVLYSIPSEISPKKRRVDIVIYLFNILSLWQRISLNVLQNMKC